jgi:hypothetical protein
MPGGRMAQHASGPVVVLAPRLRAKYGQTCQTGSELNQAVLAKQKVVNRWGKLKECIHVEKKIDQYICVGSSTVNINVSEI